MKFHNQIVNKWLAVALVVAASIVGRQACALSSDKNQTMNADANHSHFLTSKTGAANDPDISHLDGAVHITRGSIDMRAAHATIYQIPDRANSPNAGKYSHIVLTGTPAHMQQVHDGDCSLMTADAVTIDYKPLEHLAELTGDVRVVQGSRGETRSQHMIYNTDTGEMQSGDASAGSRVHLVMRAKSTAPPATQSPNCGFPGAAKSTGTKDKH